MRQAGLKWKSWRGSCDEIIVHRSPSVCHGWLAIRGRTAARATRSARSAERGAAARSTWAAETGAARGSEAAPTRAAVNLALQLFEFADDPIDLPGHVGRPAAESAAEPAASATRCPANARAS